MFSLNESDRFMVFGNAVNLRKGIESPCVFVRMYSMVPPDGSVYVFLYRYRTRMKLLHWERGGYVIFYKRMERGRIRRTVFRTDAGCGFILMRWDEIVLLVEGVAG
mgnify:CR=1 FL=1